MIGVREPWLALSKVVLGAALILLAALALSWNMRWARWACAATRLTLGTNGAMADADHLIGALALTVISLAAAEVARALRFLLVPLGAALLITPFVYGEDVAATAASIACGIGLIVFAIRRGAVTNRYGSWQRVIV